MLSNSLTTTQIMIIIIVISFITICSITWQRSEDFQAEVHNALRLMSSAIIFALLIILGVFIKTAVTAAISPYV